ncbi:hypothetical protein R1flu_025859 [Riccia fluitans]|uniref:Secreted protein n=1 Tax=Riccia fluitans TaxID=41844 RepID=A0ABD1XYX8_9MARC
MLTQVRLFSLCMTALLREPHKYYHCVNSPKVLLRAYLVTSALLCNKSGDYCPWICSRSFPPEMAFATVPPDTNSPHRAMCSGSAHFTAGFFKRRIYGNIECRVRHINS